MADVEKVVKGLECCGRNNVKYCRNCPYWPEMDCVEKMAADAVQVLKWYEENLAKLKALAYNVDVETLLRSKTE